MTRFGIRDATDYYMLNKAQTMKPAQHVPFVIGRLAKDGSRIVFLHPALRPPFPGPWEVRAVYGPADRVAARSACSRSHPDPRSTDSSAVAIAPTSEPAFPAT